MPYAENFKIINSVTLLKYAEIFDYMLKHASWSPPHTLQPFCDKLCDFPPFNVNFTAVLCSELSDDCTHAHVNSTRLNTCFLHKHNNRMWIQPALGHYAHYIRHVADMIAWPLGQQVTWPAETEWLMLLPVS